MKSFAFAGLLSALALSAHAQPETPTPPAPASGDSSSTFKGLYVGGALGADLLSSQTYRTTTQPYFGDGYSSSVTSHVVTQGGADLAGRVSVGWAFQDGLRVELEGGYSQTALKFRGASETINWAGAGTAGAIPLAVSDDRTIHGEYQRYTAMLNLLYDVPTPVWWAKPYVGVGAGALIGNVPNMRLIVEGVSNAYPGRTSASTWMNGQTDIQPSAAVQLIVGSAFPLKAVPGLSLTADYRLLGSVSAQSIPHGPTNAIGYGVGNWGGSCNTFTNFCDASNLRTGSVTGGLSQSVMVGLRYQIP